MRVIYSETEPLMPGYHCIGCTQQYSGPMEQEAHRPDTPGWYMERDE
jgi:hypothetical protein